MISFENDYSEGAAPEILRALTETNLEQHTGYGRDEHSDRARDYIRRAVELPEAEVFLLAGGTQVNQVALDALLDRCEGVIAADTGHVSLHEGGAIEKTGHKVLTVPGRDGKIDPGALAAYLAAFDADEARAMMVQPGAVYISYPTEYGTLYAKAELEAIFSLCRARGLKLFIDGARLGYGLAARGSDLTLPELARLCDAFTIGATKVGALLGEALVFPRGGACRYMETFIKQHGALLAKGRVLGVQFETLFRDGLYRRLAENAILRAEEMKAIFREKGYTFYLETPTNQQFILLTDEKTAALREKVRFCFWEKPDPAHTVVRFATSWATTADRVAALRGIL
ncbi:MAG: aminotransferase class I/II-fold pyridoxal phosphate-dependent enzyme [Clostridia bacterium]|nr:aminotransferase class I/II-fold pyridoxal phosphate-dependent enzyme [Clostridia bacterium]